MNTIAVFLLATVAALAAPTNHLRRQWNGNSPTAAYFLLNNPSGNEVVALNVSLSSSSPLSNPIKYETGGAGAFGTANGAVTQSDTLFSVNSVHTAGNYVLNVNAGSNTISLFSINPENPVDLKLIDTIHSGGDFPNSVAYSPEFGIACVANSGAINGIACFTVSESGLSPHTPLFHTGQFNQTTPPSGPKNTYSQVAWNPYSNILTVTMKGVMSTTPGYLLQFTYNPRSGTFSSPISSTSVAPLDLVFGFAFINATSMVAVSPGYGFGIIEGLNKYTDVQCANISVPTSNLTCWSQWDSALNTAYALDAGENTIYTIKLGSSSVGTMSNGNPGGVVGTYDTIVTNGFLMGLTGGTGFTVINLNDNNQHVQWFNTSASVSPTRQYYEGFVVYPNIQFDNGGMPGHGGGFGGGHNRR